VGEGLQPGLAAQLCVSSDTDMQTGYEYVVVFGRGVSLGAGVAA
jgi:hypothetical protein